MLQYAEMQNHIRAAQDDDTIELFDEAIKVFDLYQTPGYMEIFETTFANLVDPSDVEVILAWQKNLREILTSLMNYQGVVLVDDILISDLLEIARASFEFIFNEDKQTLFRQIESIENESELYAEIISNNSSLGVEFVLSQLLSVPDNLGGIIKGRLLELQEEQTHAKELGQILKRYAAFKKTTHGQTYLFADQLINNPRVLGLPMENYVSMFLAGQHRPSETDQETYKRVSKELFALACLSCDGFSNPVHCVRQIVSQVYSDVQACTVVITQLNGFNSEMLNHEQV
jgi:hypothetical protein